jgi:phosphoglycolate phosphatase
MGKVIQELHDEGHTLLIVSSNNNRNIRRFLHQHHLYKFFTDIQGEAGFFGKRRIIRLVIWRNKVDRHEAVYIGDEARDIIASKAAGVRVIAASWGFDQADVLAKHEPVAIAHQPQDIVRILEEI